ncbi:MAG: hypothetical protein PHP35_02675, partial [Candidatus Colwellbacteria bacterium]|nr:hypothetical protein [Candidatus Colwellbacteria bacterium]
MKINPVINCPSESCFIGRLCVAKWVLDPEAVIHVDVSDGVFTPWKTWATVPIIKKIVSSCPGLKLAVHLMVEN